MKVKVECPNCGEKNKMVEVGIINVNGTVVKIPTYIECWCCSVRFVGSEVSKI